LYFIQDYQVILENLKAMESLNLDLADQFSFASVPLGVSKDKASKWIYQMASQFKKNGCVRIDADILTDYKL
jgi:hypothetical protein